MAYQLTILWVVWSVGAVFITVGLIVLNIYRRRRMARAGDETPQSALPTLRDDLAWGALVLLAGGVGLGINLWLLRDGHTARVFLVSAVFGLVMLLGLLMLLKNGLAPTDVLRLDAEEATGTAPLDAPEGDGVEREAYPKAEQGF